MSIQSTLSGSSDSERQALVASKALIGALDYYIQTSTRLGTEISQLSLSFIPQLLLIDDTMLISVAGVSYAMQLRRIKYKKSLVDTYMASIRRLLGEVVNLVEKVSDSSQLPLETRRDLYIYHSAYTRSRNSETLRGYLKPFIDFLEGKFDMSRMLNEQERKLL